MPPKESHYPRDWFRIAEKDFKRAEQLVKLDDAEGAGYNLQQAVEKYLKGFLLSKGWKLKRVHDLEVLLNDALQYEPTLEEFRGLCQTITDYFLLDRYPLPISITLTIRQVESSKDQAQQLIAKLQALTE